MIENIQHGEVRQIAMKPDPPIAPAFWVSAYFVDGMIIDSGCRHTHAELVESLDDQRLLVGVNTHYHEDHITANGELMERHGIRFHAHPESIPLIGSFPELPWYREDCWGRPESSETLPIPDRIETERFVFDVVETPGHCRGHVALLEQERGWCFTGDLYVGKKLLVAGPETDIAALTASMIKLLDIDTEELILFTSLRTVEMDGKSALREAVRYFEDLCGSAKLMHSKGMETGAIRDRLLGGPDPLDHVTGGRYSTERLIAGAIEAELPQSTISG
ncbi:MAG: MBL fold metallo-hydrolase [Pseudomonadota bacterium]